MPLTDEGMGLAERRGKEEGEESHSKHKHTFFYTCGPPAPALRHCRVMR